MFKLRNLTPHPIVILDGDKNIIEEIGVENVEKPRLSEKVENIGTINKFPISYKIFSGSENLPDPKKGVFLIVSGLIASAEKRSDLLVPNVVRDESGRIIGCDGFSIIKEATVEEELEARYRDLLPGRLQKEREIDYLDKLPEIIGGYHLQIDALVDEYGNHVMVIPEKAILEDWDIPTLESWVDSHDEVIPE